MVGFYKFNAFKYVVLSSVICSFSLAVVAPPPVYGLNIDFNGVNFGVKVQKLIDKALKYYKKSDSNALLDVVLEIKSEVEAHTKQRD